MANVEGKAYAINVVTPLVSWKAFILRIYFRIILLAIGLVGKLDIPRHFGFLASIPLVRTQLNLKKLSFIYFARWTLVGQRDFPHLGDGQPVEDLEYDYLIFNSNFTGTWDAYIDAFSEIIPDGIDGIWQWTVNYRRTRPLTPFKQHIAANQADTDYYYSAYPGASTTDVRLAFALASAFDVFADRALAMPSEHFESAYSDFLNGIQNQLATTGHDEPVAPRPDRRVGPGDLPGCEPAEEAACPTSPAIPTA
jgi:hypothetical protein